MLDIWILIFVIIFLVGVFMIYYITTYYDPQDTANVKTLMDQINTKIEHKVVSRIKYPVYYINLQSNIERNKYMNTQLKKYAQKFERIEGVNGKNIVKDAKCNMSGKIDDINYKTSYKLTPSEIGCTLSHLKAIKRAYDNGDDIALIMEDDVYFGIYAFTDNLEKIISEAPSNWENLQLCCMNNKKHSTKYILRDKRHNYASAAAYLINRKGMEKIINHSFKEDNKIIISPIEKKFPRHGVADIYIYELCISYTYIPGIFIGNDVNFQSTIKEADRQEHIYYWLQTLSYYKKDIITP